MTAEQQYDEYDEYDEPRRRRRKRGRRRRPRLRHTGYGSWELVLWFPRIRKRQVRSARRWNTLLMVTWIPLLINGVKFLFTGNRIQGDALAGFRSLMIGLAAGLVMHELSHAAAGLAYGAKLEEIGLMTSGFIPSGYCRIDTEDIQSRFELIQIDAAGIECNFALAGLLLTLIDFHVLNMERWVYAALINLLLGLGNTIIYYGNDGSHIIGTVLGEDSVEKALTLFFSPRRKRRLRRRGIFGRLKTAAANIMMLMQLTLPLLILTEILFFAWYLWQII